MMEEKEEKAEKADCNMGNIFSTDQGIVEEVWRNNPNYLVREINADNKKCLILFSSNGLYFPNTREEFEEKVIQEDRYEFRNITNSKKIEKQFGKIIYVRDVWKAWYVRGINAREDTIDKLIARLKDLTEEERVITAGISSGGYMSVIAGIKLNAEKILCFSGQFYLDVSKRSLLKEYEEDEERSKYYDLIDLIRKTDVPIIYFYPMKYNGDIKQADKVKEFHNVVMIAFDYAEHAQTVLPCNFKYLFDMSEETYRKISRRCVKKAFKKLPFLFMTGGVEGIADCFRGVIPFIRKKIASKTSCKTVEHS